ncbi:tRNA (guanosine(46)-N7)-methyltransferase TrmB [Dactylosporangium sucinum]|uniref:tRNA (guanine-N(7)-)-methyltransferase n=1 Tax=Dactylosporangium sucinum TaxID=1424081 RepID=A0A917T7D8_9ACTN|nr:tRNA (guanosine(46)-N7)-methyltransferase TrmB [Dactylosporangium sucinum]GGM13376.1 tRNA (guanine-N(7)-)-methyltransferase [Dactylosporangium sucinum]
MTTVERPRKPIRTYHPRRGRLSGRHFDALHRLADAFAFAPGDPVDVLEIGSGMGEATVEMAAADPARRYLAVEIHTPGVANLLSLIEQHGLTNLRVVSVDALELLRTDIPLESLDAVHVFFPDPWPKARHHKRRLIQPGHVALLRDRLRPGGVLHCATDDAGYAEAMLETLTADPRLRNLHDGFAPRPPHRPLTKFEQRAIRDGRPSFDLMYVKS